MRSGRAAEAILEGGGATVHTGNAIGRHKGLENFIGLLVQYASHVGDGHSLLEDVEFHVER